MTNLTMHKNFSFMKCAKKSVPGLADVGVPHRDGGWPQNSAHMPGGARKKSQMTNLSMPDNFFS